VNESVTIAGEDAQISGDGDGSVITVRAPDVALTGLAVDGSGGQTRDPEAAREGRADDGGVNGSDDGEVWDTNIQLGYGHGDAGIRAIGAPGLVVDDVTVEANASGLLLREGSLTRSSATSESTGRIAGRTASWESRGWGRE